MKNIKIETLTPVHIGSGRDLSANTEFLQFYEDDETILTVVDEEKVLNIIGVENIDKWTSIIQKKGNFKEYLLLRKKELKANDVSKRIIYADANNISRNNTLKEQMFDGRQISYIPGSSIKGAIRTAIVAELALKNSDFAKDNLKTGHGYKEKFSASTIEKKLFGRDANSDVFRFLQVGDAYFEYDTIALKTEILNYQRNGWDYKHGKSSLIECIPDDAESNFKLKINKQQLKLNKTYTDTSFLNEEKLFEIINKHTKQLLEKEIEFWQAQENIRHDEFIDKLEEVSEIAKKCNKNEAVLRIGFGSGWKFITGDWATNEKIMTNSEYDNFLSQARRKNYSDDVPFPKTRMLGDQGDIFGFVKLTY